MTISNNPYAVAVEEAERSFINYGQVQVTCSFVVLKKGEKKRPWIEGQDEHKDRSTEVSILINPIPETGLTKLTERSIIAGPTGEWGKIVWPSLRDACGVTDLQAIDNKYCKAELVKNGRTWVDKNGEKAEGTTFKFHAIYDTQEACAEAYLADGNTSRTATETSGDDAAMAIDMSPAPASDVAEKEAAKIFLAAVVKQSNGNKDALATTLKALPGLNKFFTIDSPEVAQLMAA